MKTLLIYGVFFFISTSCFSQKYNYSFKLNENVSADYVKLVYDPIRQTFNNFTNPFQNVLNFDYDSRTFSIASEIDITREELDIVLQKHQYSINTFNKTK
ncbi:MAG: hypothetical protein K0R65_1080 [Crocinitomicaceae bacterium]|jgi:hypothetical protein|nr:hypothetical protein [Crocinitomicaceae bacterium]